MNNNIIRDPNRIKYTYRKLGSFAMDDGNIRDFLSEFKQKYDNIVERYKDNEPGDITISSHIDGDDGDYSTEFEVSASLVESEAEYEYRMKSIKESDEAEERRIANRAEMEAISEQAFREAKEKKERERLQAILLAHDPELAEYERLKTKFEAYENSKRDYEC